MIHPGIQGLNLRTREGRRLKNPIAESFRALEHPLAKPHKGSREDIRILNILIDGTGDFHKTKGNIDYTAEEFIGYLTGTGCFVKRTSGIC